MINQRRLRKQPRLRRMQATGSAALPHIVVPPAAKKRKRRNRRRIGFPSAIFKQIVTSTRWASLGLLALSVWALFVVGRDETFFLTEVPVEGIKSIPASAVVNSSGLVGTHIFAADPRAAAARIWTASGDCFGNGNPGVAKHSEGQRCRG